MMQQHGVLGFRWHPHAATGAVLLEVYFVSSPEVDRSIFHQPLEFFLCAFCRSGSAFAIAGRGFLSPKTQCRKKTRDLPYAQVDPVLPLDPGRQRLAVPQISAQA